MTGYTVHTGASKKFVSGWDRIFSANSPDKGMDSPQPNAKSKSAKKSAGAAKSKKKRKA